MWAEDTSHKCKVSGELASPQILAAPILTWVTGKLDLCVIVDAVAYLDLPRRSHEAALSGPLALPGVVVDVLHVDLDLECNRMLPDLALFCVINVCSNLQPDVWLIQEKGDGFSIDCLPNAADLFRLANCGLNTPDDQQQLLSCPERMYADVRSSATGVHWFGRQGAAYLADLALAQSDMTRIKDFVEVHQHQLDEAQPAFPAVEGSATRIAVVLVSSHSGVEFWEPCLALFVLDQAINRLKSIWFATWSVNIWTLILEFILPAIFRTMPIAQPALVLPFPTLSRHTALRVNRMFCQSSRILMVAC